MNQPSFSTLLHDGRGRMRRRVDNTHTTNWVVSGDRRDVYGGMRVIQERNSANTLTVRWASQALPVSGPRQDVPRRAVTTVGRLPAEVAWAQLDYVLLGANDIGAFSWRACSLSRESRAADGRC